MMRVLFWLALLALTFGAISDTLLSTVPTTTLCTSTSGFDQFR